MQQKNYKDVGQSSLPGVYMLRNADLKILGTHMLCESTEPPRRDHG